MIKDRMDLMRIRHTQVITDPFPEQTMYRALDRSISTFERVFGKIKWFKRTEPEEISIWRAYQMGYDKAYKEIEDSLREPK